MLGYAGVVLLIFSVGTPLLYTFIFFWYDALYVAPRELCPRDRVGVLVCVCMLKRAHPPLLAHWPLHEYSL